MLTLRTFRAIVPLGHRWWTHSGWRNGTACSSAHRRCLIAWRRASDGCGWRLELAHTELQAAHDGLLLPFLVFCMRCFALLVGRFGLAVDDLKLADDEDHGPKCPRRRWRPLEQLSRKPHGHVDDIVNDAIVVGGEDV